MIDPENKPGSLEQGQLIFLTVLACFAVALVARLTWRVGVKVAAEVRKYMARV